MQFNAKATTETINKIYKLADERKVPLGELLRLACEALKRRGLKLDLRLRRVFQRDSNSSIFLQ